MLRDAWTVLCFVGLPGAVVATSATFSEHEGDLDFELARKVYKSAAIGFFWPISIPAISLYQWGFSKYGSSNSARWRP